MIRLDCRPNYFGLVLAYQKQIFFLVFPTTPHRENQPLCLANIKAEVSESVSKKPPNWNIAYFLSNCSPSSRVGEANCEGKQIYLMNLKSLVLVCVAR